MPKITIGIRIGAGYLVLGVLLLLCGMAGYWVEHRLSVALEQITGPMLKLDKSVGQGIESVQRQMIAVDRVMRGQERGYADLDQALNMTNVAHAAVQQTGLLPTAKSEALDRDLGAFNQARTHLLEISQRRMQAEQLLDTNINQFRDFFIEVEKLASQKLLEVQMKGVEAGEDAEFMEREATDSINAATEARLALLTRQYLYHRLIDEGSDERIGEAMRTALEDLRFSVENVGLPEFFATVVARGPFAGKTYREGLADLLNEHQKSYHEATQAFGASVLALESYAKAAQDLENLGGLINELSRERLQSEVEQGRRVAIAGGWTIAVSVVIGLVVALGVTILALRTIAVPVRAISRQMQDLAGGEGDLRHSLPVNGRDELADLAEAFNGFIAKIRNTVIELQRQIQRLGASTGEISSVAERTGSEVTRQQEEISGITAAVDELCANVQSVAADTSQAADRNGAASKAVEEGRSIVTETRSITDRLSAEVERASGVIRQLGAESDRIGGVLDVIRDISEQTNLLALNAAIEAARAGEHGRGFAVVADEVRNLAARTHDSTNEIRDMIERLQTGAREAVEAMLSSGELSQSNVDHAGRTGESLAVIDEAVQALGALNTHIAEVSELQNRHAEAVSQSIGNVNEVAGATVADARELNNTTEDLVRLATELDGLASQFKV